MPNPVSGFPSAASIHDDSALSVSQQSSRSTSPQQANADLTEHLTEPLKKIAIDSVPLEKDKALVSEFLDRLHALDNANQTAINELASEVIQAGMRNVALMEAVFNYMNCRFILEQHQLAINVADEKRTQARNEMSKSMGDLSKPGNPKLAKALRELQNSGAKIGPVVTSHPTQLNRPELQPVLALWPSGGFHTEADKEVFVNQLWDSAKRRTSPPTVVDEAQGVVLAMGNILKSIRKKTKELMNLGNTDTSKLITPVLNSENWIAGDRDGNPTITPALLTQVLGMFSDLAFQEYLGKVSDTPKENRSTRLCDLFKRLGRSDDLTDLRQRLEATRRYVVDNVDGPETACRFKSPAELVEHVNTLKENLCSPLTEDESPSPDQALLATKLDQLALWAKAFGFHAAGTHIRQNSAVNAKVVAQLLKHANPGSPCDNYSTLSEGDKVNTLNEFLERGRTADLDQVAQQISDSAPDDATIKLELDFLKNYAHLRERFGPGALPTIITANTETLSDMLEVCVLLKHAKLNNDDADLGMNIVPLIETVPDMKNAEALLEEMLGNKTYREHLEKRGNRQVIMLGYSDSMRCDGIFSAAWEGHKLTGKLLDIAKKHGVGVHFFHGRGGTEARGSRGNYFDEIQHVNGASLTGGCTQTEQGEEVYKKFGMRAVSDNHISQMVDGTLATYARDEYVLEDKHTAALDFISEKAGDAYRALYNDPQLPEFLLKSTPLAHVSKTNAGSRPASRIADLKDKAFLDKLRAIPYVGSWYQSGSNAPAYYGIGAGLRAYIQEGPGNPNENIQLLRDMYKNIPVFRNLIDRAEEALNKADMSIAQLYAETLNPETAPLFHGLIKPEFDNTCQQIDLVKEQNTETRRVPTKPLQIFAHMAQIELLKQSSHTEASRKLYLENQRQVPAAIEEEKTALDAGIAMSMQVVANANGRFG